MTTFRRFVSSLFFSLLFSFQVLSFHPSTYNAACIIYNFFMSFIVFMFGIYISPFLQHVNSLVFIFINILSSFWCSLRAKKKKEKVMGDVTKTYGLVGGWEWEWWWDMMMAKNMACTEGVRERGTENFLMTFCGFTNAKYVVFIFKYEYDLGFETNTHKHRSL